jgi:hypothetical protein
VFDILGEPNRRGFGRSQTIRCLLDRVIPSDQNEVTRLTRTRSDVHLEHK